MLEPFALDLVSLNIATKKSFGSAFRCKEDSVDLFHMTMIGFCFVVCARLFVTETHFLRENSIHLNACADCAGDDRHGGEILCHAALPAGVPVHEKTRKRDHSVPFREPCRRSHRRR